MSFDFGKVLGLLLTTIECLIALAALRRFVHGWCAVGQKLKGIAIDQIRMLNPWARSTYFSPFRSSRYMPEGAMS